MMQKFNLIVNLEWQWTLAFIWFPFPSKRKSKKHLHWQSEKKNFRHKLPKVPSSTYNKCMFPFKQNIPNPNITNKPSDRTYVLYNARSAILDIYYSLSFYHYWNLGRVTNRGLLLQKAISLFFLLQFAKTNVHFYHLKPIS